MIPVPQPIRENNVSLLEADFRTLFESAPGAYLVLRPDDPVFTIMAVSDAYLRATLTVREKIIGRAVFEVFPDNPGNLAANGVRNLRASLQHVVATKAAHRMPLQRYDIRCPSGTFEERYWSPLNTPVLDAAGMVQFLIHTVEDVTARVRAEEQLRRSERRLQATQDHAGVGIHEVSANGHYLSISESFTRLTGYTLADFAGRTYFDLIEGEEDRQRTRETFARLVRGEIDAFRDSRPYTNKAGRRWWAEMQTTAIRDEEGRFLYAVRVLEDVTERKRLEGALRASEEKLQQVFAQAPVAIAVFRGRDFLVELANPAYQALLPGRKLVGRRFAEVVPELGAEVWAVRQQVFDTGEASVNSELQVRYDQDGDGVSEDHWFNVVYHPLREVDGAVSGQVVICSEVTAQVLARRELERVNRELEEFAYVASHDLQEPLRMVNIYTELILKNQKSNQEVFAEYAGFVRRGVTRMEGLIRDLLAYSRTIYQEPLPVGTADLSVSLHEAVMILQSRIEESGATITAPPLPTVRGDTKQMAQVFQNLLSNALKYHKPNILPEIHVTVEPQGAQWVVAVRDNGIGFEQQYAERIFGLFKRLHKDEYPGTGLGLAICQRIVERYGGRLWAEGRLGQGATFFFALPSVEEN